MIELEPRVSGGKGIQASIPQPLKGVRTLTGDKRQQRRAMRVIGNHLAPEMKPGDVVHSDPERGSDGGELVVASRHGARAVVWWLADRDTMQHLLPLPGEPLLSAETSAAVGAVENIARQAPRRRSGILRVRSARCGGRRPAKSIDRR